MPEEEIRALDFLRNLLYDAINKAKKERKNSVEGFVGDTTPEECLDSGLFMDILTHKVRANCAIVEVNGTFHVTPKEPPNDFVLTLKTEGSGVRFERFSRV